MKARGFSAILGLFLLIPLALIPTVSALIWTVETLDTDSGAVLSGDPDIAVKSDASLIVIVYTDTNVGGGFRQFRSTGAGFAGSQIHPDGYNGKTWFQGTNVLVCATSNTGDVTTVYRSADALSYSATFLTNDGDHCQGGAFGTNNVVVGYYDDSATDSFAEKSADAGATFGAPVQVSTTELLRAYGFKSATTWAFVGDTQFCITTDTGATYTCTTTTVNHVESVAFFGGSTWYIAGHGVEGPGSPLLLAKTLDNGATWQTPITVYTPSGAAEAYPLGGNADAKGNDLFLHDENTYTIIFQESLTSVTVGCTTKAAFTSDAGATWQIENIDASTQISGQNRECFGVTADYTLNRFRVGFAYGTFGGGGQIKYASAPATLSGGGGGGTGGGAIVGVARDFCSDAWGFDCGWLILIGCVGLVTIGFARVTSAPLMIGLGAFLGLGLAVLMLDDFVWVLFVAVFIVIAIAGRNLFGGGEDEGD